MARFTHECHVHSPRNGKIHFLLKWIFEAQVGFLHLNSLVNCHDPCF